jgi:hypothetical protein
VRMALFDEGDVCDLFQGTGIREPEDLFINEYCIPESCVYQFTSLNMFEAKCSSTFRSGTPYVAFYCIGNDVLEQIDRYCERHQKSTRVLYDEELELLIVNLLLHRQVVFSFSRELYLKLSSMGHGLSPYSLDRMGGTRYGAGSGRQKEADGSFKPSTHVGGDTWPSFVIEVGVSETLSQ